MAFLSSRISNSAEVVYGEYGSMGLKGQWASTSFCFNFPNTSSLALLLIIASGTPTLLNRAPTASWACKRRAMGSFLDQAKGVANTWLILLPRVDFTLENKES
jgi:hypothetical protein